jgi:hypothetical protein
MLLFSIAFVCLWCASGEWRTSLWTLPYLASLFVALWLAHLASANSLEEGKRHPWAVFWRNGFAPRKYFAEKGERLRWLPAATLLAGFAASCLWFLLSRED